MIVPIIIISFFVGSLLYPKTADEFFDNYGTGMSNVYNFANLLSDWISLIIFGFIAASCFGYARSLSKNKKWLKIMNYFIVFVIYFAIAANVLSIFIDLSLYIYHYNNLSSIITNKELLNSKINGYIISISTLIIMILIMVVPAIFNKKKQRN
ncbi:amino acid permease [Mycoplasma anatis]|nr:hypothetical protein [Mycoplasmopsis anatis]MBW0599168.1 amino acid permease [Mycoplasmopsis anatis]